MTRGQKCFTLAVLFLVVVAVGRGLWLTSKQSDEVTSKDRRGTLSLSNAEPPLPQKPQPAEQGFVGSEVCSQCHQSIAETYRSHPMSRSLASVKDLVAAENELGDHLVEPAGARKYRVQCDGKQMWHHESLSGPDGEPIYDQQVEVAFALGSASRGRAYLLERDGRLFASSLNWYARTHKWGLAPGYSPTSHKRFEREVGPGCLVCHTGRMSEDPAQPSEPSSPIFAEITIGCERCHGPGQRHIDFQLARKESRTDSKDSDPITNPVKLDTARREDVCNQCHLQGRSQHLRYGRHVFDFRPGMRLEDVWMIFLSEEEIHSDGPTAAVTQVGQMRSSVCYSKSDGRLGCLSCHDAHSVPAPAERADYYRKRCMSCHSDKGCKLPEAERLNGPEANSCVACHMPSVGTSDVPHTSQTDHRVLRQPPKESPAEPAAHSTHAEFVLFDDAARRIPKWEAQRARGLMLAGLAEATRDRRVAAEAEPLLEATWKIARDDVETIELLGVSKLLLGKTSQARKLWQTGLEMEPRRESLLIRLAFFSHEMKDLTAAAAYFGRLVEVSPTHADFHGRYAHILGQLGDIDRGIKEANRAIELDPTLSQAHEWLAQVYQTRKREDLSKYHQEMARKLHQAGF